MKKGTLHKVNLTNERHAELPSCLGNASDSPAHQIYTCLSAQLARHIK